MPPATLPLHFTRPAAGPLLLSAVPVLLAAATPAETRTGEVGNLDAMTKAKQPAWVAVANPFVGFVGVLLGARLRRPTASA